MKAEEVIKDLKKLANPKKAKILSRFFKTEPGQYGEGDVFWGITVPAQRQIVKKYLTLPLSEIKKLLHNKVHECRLTGVLILVDQFEKTNEVNRKRLHRFYLANSVRMNNWDLVDCSARMMVGEYLVQHQAEIKLLDKLVKSKNLWQRRIAVLASWAFIRRGRFDVILDLTKKLMNDSHDLMHKAVGWMLREVGKKDQKVLEKFLDEYATKLPRTALRYAIERLSPDQRFYYIKIK
ncbi:MAG: DNA alkylation repair protein [Candidatus Komeilibacteria bacterium]|nr:DNA alkylation repair protein [Candidatus Komeilibacteria bacterium]